MKKVYEASNALEAQLLCDWLQQSGVHAKVEGSYLQGGVGELQAMGIVRVLVDDADIYAAQQAIRDWDALHSGAGSEHQRAERVRKLGREFGFKFVALGGAVLMLLLFLALFS